MGFNYGYKLNDNPKLTSLGEISFEPVTEEHRARVDREIAISQSKDHALSYDPFLSRHSKTMRDI